MAQQVLYILFSFEFPVMKQMRYFADGFTSLCSKVIGLIKIDIRNQLIDTHLLEGCLMEFERCYLHTFPYTNTQKVFISTNFR